MWFCFCVCHLGVGMCEKFVGLGVLARELVNTHTQPLGLKEQAE